MIEERGVVTHVSADGHALVEVQRKAACNGCSGKSGCGVGAISGLLGSGKGHSVRVLNRVQAAPGDTVVLGLRDEDLVRLSVKAYLLPLLFMLMGGGTGEFLARWWVADSSSELLVIMGSLAGLILGLAALRRGSGAWREAVGEIVMLRKEPSRQDFVSFS